LKNPCRIVEALLGVLEAAAAGFEVLPAPPAPVPAPAPLPLPAPLPVPVPVPVEVELLPEVVPVELPLVELFPVVISVGLVVPLSVPEGVAVLVVLELEEGEDGAGFAPWAIDIGTATKTIRKIQM